jgi:hypothetical protein
VVGGVQAGPGTRDGLIPRVRYQEAPDASTGRQPLSAEIDAALERLTQVTVEVTETATALASRLCGAVPMPTTSGPSEANVASSGLLDTVRARINATNQVLAFARSELQRVLQEIP